MKKSELKSYIEEEIINELTIVDKNTKPEDLKGKDPKTITTAIDQAKKTGLPVNIAEESGIPKGRSVVEYIKIANQIIDADDIYISDKYRMLISVIEEIGKSSNSGLEENLNEMAKISGDLKSAIDKVMDANPEADITSLKKTIQSDEAVLKALAGSKLHDTQLAKFISATKGEREIGKRGPKVDPNKPKPEPKAPKKAIDPRNKKTKLTTSKIDGRKYYSKGEGDEEGPSDLELRKLAKSGGGKLEKSKISLLQQQERTKLVKEFLAGLKKFGIIDNANRIIDKEKYDKAWEVEKEAIRKQVEKLK
jgi:hypothetical protein